MASHGKHAWQRTLSCAATAAAAVVVPPLPRSVCPPTRCRARRLSQHPCGHPKCTMLGLQPSPPRRQLWRRRFRVPRLPARHPSRSVLSSAAAPQGAAMHGGAHSRWVVQWVMSSPQRHRHMHPVERLCCTPCVVQDGCADGLGGTLPFQSCSLRAANCTMPPLVVSGPGVQVTTGDLRLCCCTH